MKPHSPACERNREPIAAVLALERQIRSVWERHPGYQFVPARESVDEKYAVFVEIV